MTSKIIDILKSGFVTVPMLLINNYSKLNITDKELVLIIYLIYNSDFDPERISTDLNIKIPEVLQMIDSLSKKDILKIEMLKSDVVSEHINLNELYNKLALILINDEKEQSTTIYDKFEKEFARPLSPMEYQIIGAWLDDNYSEELIEQALKEAIYSDAPSLKYIDRILVNWRKKGIKNKGDVEKEINNHKNKKTKKEVFEYDWLNE